MIFLGSNPASAAAASSTSAVVSIRIEPIAEVSFPLGTRFVIMVPGPVCLPQVQRPPRDCRPPWWQYWPPIPPVRIPFVVRGNASATLSVRPDVFLRLSTGRYLGRAARNNATLGYNLAVVFPLPDISYHWPLDWTEKGDWGMWGDRRTYGALPEWSQIASLPGLDGVDTPPLTANLPARGDKGYGAIYVVAAHHWTATGRSAAPGNYFGSIEMTVTATQ